MFVKQRVGLLWQICTKLTMPTAPIVINKNNHFVTYFFTRKILTYIGSFTFHA